MPASRSFSSFVRGDFLVDLEDDLAGLLVDDVVRRDLAASSSTSAGRRSSFASFSFFIAALRELGVLLDDDLAADLDVARRALAGEELVLDATSSTCRPSRGRPSRCCRSS